MGIRTINTLEAAARRDVDVVTVGTKQFHGVNARDICSTAWDNMCSITIYTRTCAECALLVLVNL